MTLWRNSRLKLTDVEGGANVGVLLYNPATCSSATTCPTR